MATIRDIAERAGVSMTTVSNVLHGRSSRVSAETVERIEEIIRETGYTPNMNARVLVGSSSRIIGVISSMVPISSGGIFQDPFHAVLLSGIEKCTRDLGYFLMVRSVEDANELESLLTNWNIDGLIMIGFFPESFYAQLEEMRKPYVQIDSSLRNRGLKIWLDDETGGYLATRYLIENGHRRIVFVCTPMQGSRVVGGRHNGYLRALAEAGIEEKPEDLCEIGYTIEAGIEMGEKLAERHDFTAIFACADLLACSVCTGLMMHGRRVPDEISIVGYDDTAMARLNCPPLTCVHQDVAGRGAKAVEMLVDAIEKGEGSEPYTFPVTLVERQSVRRIIP